MDSLCGSVIAQSDTNHSKRSHATSAFTDTYFVFGEQLKQMIAVLFWEKSTAIPQENGGARGS
jgi:hypothetical protein